MPDVLTRGHVDVDAVRTAFRAVREELGLTPAEAAEAVGSWFDLTPGEVFVLLGFRPLPHPDAHASWTARSVVPDVGRTVPERPHARLLPALERLVRHGTYLLTAFPLGLLYLVGSLVGLSLGAGLAVILVGLVVLAAVGMAWSVCLDLERELAVRLLGVRFHDGAPPTAAGPWRALRARVTLRGVAFLALKFPLGVATLVVLATATGLSLAPFAAAAALFAADGGDAALVSVPLGLIALAVGAGAMLVLAAVVDAMARGWAGLAAAFLTRGGTTPAA